MIDGDSIVNGIAQRQAQALPSVVGNIDENPDDAQRAMDLATATGVPATSIYGNLDEFERQNKAAMASSIVAGNPHLADFVQSNPMVPKIANGDYASLDKLSQSISSASWLHRTANALDLSKYAFPADADPLARFKGGGPIGDTGASLADLQNHPFASAVAAAVATPFDLFFRGIGGTLETGADMAKNIATSVGGESFGREVGAVVETEAMGLSGHHAIHLPEGEAPNSEVQASPLVSDKVAESIQRALVYARNGREPPPTILPEYDKYLADRNAQEVDQLGEMTKNAQEPFIKEAAPDLLKQFIDQHTPASIGVSGEMVAKLYGDKLPTPDDGLLGWVPGIEDKLNLARATGDDVSIPISDWLSKGGNEVFPLLKDDIRTQPNGITANEAKLWAEQAAANPPTEPLPELVPQTRAASALEPLFSVGDRNLKIERLKGAEGAMFGPEHGFHDFSINDQNGNPVGTINLSEQRGGKDIYVEMINGIGGLGPRDFGPRLMFDLKRQLKAEFPQAERLGGHRVGGMRAKFGTYDKPSALVWVKLDALDTQSSYDDLRRILTGGQWETYSPNIKAYVKPDVARSAEDRKLADVVNAELDRIVPKKTATQVVDKITANTAGVEGQRVGEDIRVNGAYIRYKDTYPIILAALDADNVLGTARHEAIHHLRQYSFFDKEEWSTLENEALAGGWLKKYNIDRRYPTGSPSLKLEESIAEAYMDWTKQQDALGERAREIALPPSPLDAIFQKMKDFFDAIKQRIGALLWKDNPTWEDIFKRVDTGEVGGREGTEPLDPKAFNEKLSVEPPEPTSRVFERAAALGVSKDTFKKLDAANEAVYQEDVAAATKRATEEQAREQTKQWKEDRKALRPEVANDIRQRPDVAADLFFGAGELYGKKVPLGSVKLDASALSEVQKAGLPRNYYGEHGLHPDDVANLFGYGSGDAMVDRLVQYNAAKLQAGGMSAKDFVSRVTDIETDRQMKMKYGALEDNIVDAVKEQVTGEVSQRRMEAELDAFAEKHKLTLTDRASVKQQLKDAFAKMPLGSVSSDSYMRAAGKAGRKLEGGLLDGRPQEALTAKLEQYYATVMANEASKFEKELGKGEKLMKKYGKAFDPKKGTIDAKYSLAIRNLLSKIEKPYGMSVQGMADAIGRSGFNDLGDFVKQQNELYGIAGIQLPVADFLKDPGFHKAFTDMTVDEARETMQSVKTLDVFGRSVEKVNVAGEKQERRDLINKMNTQLETKFEPLDHGASKQVGTIRHYIAASTKPETFFGRFDSRDPDGLFTKTFVFPAAKASNNEAALQREFSKGYEDAGKIIDPKRKIDSPFYELDKDGKRTSQKVSGFTRENLAAVIANMGNDYNWRVFAKGWDLDPDMLWKWVEQVSKPEDFDRAQAVGKLFNKAKALDDNVHDNIYGIAPESIQVRPFVMHGKQYKGWYHPIIYDPIRSKLSKIQGIDPTEAGKYQNFWPSVASGHTIRRTGNVDVISLSNDMVSIKLNQVLHSIAYREFIHETAKITRDNAFRNTITDRYGPEYVEQIDHWINSIAGASSYNSQALAAATGLSNKVRQNVISTYIAFSPTTIEKHGLTAAKFSMQEVGHARFARVFAEVAADSFHRAVMDLFGKSEGLGETLWQFAVRMSEELQRRDRNYKETFSGVQDSITGKSSWRSWIAEKGSKGVAFSDMLSAVPTWLARYREALEENGGDVGAATQQGDRAVRRAHGSTSISNRSMIESSKGPLAPWMTSIYGFFGTDLQRQIEIAHDVNDAWKLRKQGELKQAFGKIPDISSRIFTYVIWTGLVEEAVASQFTEDHRSLLSKALSTTLGPLANTWVGLRDLAYGIEHGTDPDLGLMSSPLHDAARLVKDAKKPNPISKQNAGKLVEDAITVIGDATGLGPKHIAAPIRYGMDVWTGQQKPKTLIDVYRGLTTGQQQLRKDR